MNTRAKVLVEKLLAESTSYTIIGGRTFSELVKLDLERDGMQLVLITSASKISATQRRKIADAMRSKQITWKVFDLEGNAVIPANFEPFGGGKQYAMFDGESYAQLTFSRKTGRVLDATRYGANHIDGMLPALGRDAVCDTDGE